MLNSIAVGYGYGCGIDDDGLKCWEMGNEPGRFAPASKDPRAVSAGQDFICVLESLQVRCWYGDARNQGVVYDLMNPPPLVKNPRALTSGIFHTCVLDDEGVKCWGQNNVQQLKVPPLKHPYAIGAGASSTCALDDDGAHCWGWLDWDRPAPPRLKNPRAIGAGDDFACALDDHGVKCWGANKFGQINVPHLNNPRLLSVGETHVCAADDSGVRCWGNNSRGQTLAPPLHKVTALSAGQLQTCAFSESGLTCWGKVDKLKFKPPIVHLGSRPVRQQLSAYLDFLRRSSPVSRSLFLQRLEDFVRLNLESNDPAPSLAGAQYLALELLLPVISSNDSKWFQEDVRPRYDLAIQNIETELGLHTISAVAQTQPLSRGVALEFARAAMTTAQLFVSAADQSSLATARTAIEKALINPTEEESLRLALSEIKSCNKVFDRLSDNSKTAFLGQTLALAANWLEPR